MDKYGHLAIATNDIHRVMDYLEIKKISIIPETSKKRWKADCCISR